MEISLIIPVYNEEKNVKEVITSYINEFEAIANLKFEIIIVNDNSTDTTPKILSELENISVINNENNSGYGFSLKRGISQSLYDLIMITDADGSYTHYDAANLINKYNGEDMIVGSRNGNNVNILFYRRPAKFILNKYASFLAYSSIPDVNSGLRLFRKEAYKKYKRFLPDAFSFTTTITLSMINSREKVKFVPIDYLKRGGISKINPVRDFLNFLTIITKISLYFNPLKIFTIISFLLLISSLSIFAYFEYFNLLLPDVLLTSMIFTSVIIFSMGLLADLINKRLE